MSKVWAWIGGIVISLCIIGLILFGRSERQAYWAARAVVVRHAQEAQSPPDRMVIWRISR
jgi:hypothetical protein